jgi:tetratricopeptide (TPR) repeat protein
MDDSEQSNHFKSLSGDELGRRKRKHYEQEVTERLPLWHVGAVLLVLLCLMMGGGAHMGVQGLVLTIVGFLWWASPPKRVMPLGLWLVGGSFLVWPLVGFLPFAEENWPAWRSRVVEILGENLMGGMRTPQPWVTLEAWLLMIGMGGWILWCLGQDWVWSRLRSLVILLLSGMSILVVLAAVGYFTGVYLGVWELRTEHAKVFGFFQNRNQTGTVLALTAVFIWALIDMDLRHRKLKTWAPLWGVFYIPILGGLFLTGSRMGVLVFFGGMLAWFIITQLQRKKKQVGVAVVFVSSFLMLGAAFMIFGGRAFDRFFSLIIGEDILAEDLRFAIYKNIMVVGGEFALWGAGLGQFASVFAQYQDFTLTHYARLLHPESSWLWLFVEVGLVGVMVLMGMVLFFIIKSFPVRVGHSLSLRIAAYVGGVLFFINMMFDVPGHRVGGVMFLGLLLGFSMQNKEWLPTGGFYGMVARGIGAGVVGVGIFLMLSSSGMIEMPNSATGERLQAAALKSVENKEFNGALSMVDRWLKIEPLNAVALFMRGQLSAQLEDWDEAYNYFRVARMLEPFSVKRAYVEGQIWLYQNPVLTVEAWREILEKGDPERRGDYFGSLFSQMRPLGGEALHLLRRIARRQVDIYLKYLTLLSAKDFDDEMKYELESPEWIISLKPEQREQLFLRWARIGSVETLEQLFIQYPDWVKMHLLPYGWMLYRLNRFEEAYKALEASIERPVLPMVTLPTDRKSVRRAYYRQSEHFHIIYQYILLLKEEGNLSELIRVVERAQKLKNAPIYFTYLEAIYSAQAGSWEKACKQLLNYYQLALRAKR